MVLCIVLCIVVSLLVIIMREPAAGSGKKSDVWEYYEKIKDAPKAKYKLCNPVCNAIPLAQLGLTPQVIDYPQHYYGQ